MKPLAGMLLLASVAGSAACAVSAEPAVPAAGEYSGQLCVTMSTQAPSCGPVEVDLDARGAANVRVSDIVYRLQLHAHQVDVVLTQGQMQLDEFSVPYAWNGNALQFGEDDKNVRYELRFGERRH